jgi:alkyl sulfatase BDS1-like metallo-beta-lactamase superfamily hydrolase
MVRGWVGGCEFHLRDIPLRAFFDAMAVNLHAEEALDLNQKVGFRFVDTREAYTLWVRRGVTEIQPRLLENLDAEAEVSAQAFKELLAQRTDPVVSLARDFKMIKGNKLSLIQFFNLFKPSA